MVRKGLEGEVVVVRWSAWREEGVVVKVRWGWHGERWVVCRVAWQHMRLKGAAIVVCGLILATLLLALTCLKLFPPVTSAIPLSGQCSKVIAAGTVPHSPKRIH